MRLKITLNDGTTRYTGNVSRRKVSGILGGLERENAIMEGSCEVVYQRGYWNKFDFSNTADFKSKIAPCLDKELIGEFS